MYPLVLLFKVKRFFSVHSILFSSIYGCGCFSQVAQLGFHCVQTSFPSCDFPSDTEARRTAAPLRPLESHQNSHVFEYDYPRAGSFWGRSQCDFTAPLNEWTISGKWCTPSESMLGNRHRVKLREPGLIPVNSNELWIQCVLLFMNSVVFNTIFFWVSGKWIVDQLFLLSAIA